MSKSSLDETTEVSKTYVILGAISANDFLLTHIQVNGCLGGGGTPETA